jgi:hypothetical protein
LLLAAAAFGDPREGYGLVTGKTQHIVMGHPGASIEDEPTRKAQRRVAEVIAEIITDRKSFLPRNRVSSCLTLTDCITTPICWTRFESSRRGRGCPVDVLAVL